MIVLEAMAGAAVVALGSAYGIRFAYLAGRADRVNETRIRESLDAALAEIGRRLELLEQADAERRRQLHDLVEEYREVMGPRGQARVEQVLRETQASKDAQPKTWRSRYGLT